MVAHVDYWFSGTIRNYMLAVCRVFCNFYVDTQNKDEKGKAILRRVPCRYATSDRTVASILTGNSSNFMLAAPFMILTLSDVNMARERTQNPSAINNEQPVMRHYDPETNSYTHDRGNGYHVQRLNPAPITLTFELNIFTTNQINKQELIEQIRLIFNPSVDLQLSTNSLDWNWTNILELTNIKYSNLTYPISGSDFDVATLTFKVEGYLDPPAKVNIQKNIQHIITNIHENIEDPTVYAFENCARSESTPGNHLFKIEGDRVQLLDSDKSPSKKTWKQLLDLYGFYEPNVSKFKLRVLYDDRNKNGLEVVGTILIDDDSNMMTWDIDKDTLPEETILPVNGIINGHKQFPKKDLAPAIEGQRYIIIEEPIGSGSQAWGQFKDSDGKDIQQVNVGDIIEYIRGVWVRTFNSLINNEIEYIYNISDKKMYEWNASEGWISLLDGIWPGSRVKLILNPISEEYSIESEEEY